ncbi:MAG: hypothetical protein H6807_16555 [Planctomycetes bacterium]|nr:hypothetical protein [Planctomycetota bacterium]
MIKRVGILLSVLATGMLGACGTSGGGGHHHGGGNYGSVSDAVYHLYDVGRTDGVMEIQADRSGTIYHVEADIHPHQVPIHVMKAAMDRAGGGQVTGAEIEYRTEGMAYEVKLEKDGIDWEIVVDEDGNIVGTEEEIRRQDAPANVMDAALAALPGHFKSVEIVTAGDEVMYHVKTQDGGASYKAVVGVDGSVWLAVREARAELEIPLNP